MAIMDVNNSNLHSAKKAKNDEFYTDFNDISNELVHYKDYFRGKSVYLNCDAEWSNFWRYFIQNFNEFGLEKLTATYFDSNNKSYKLEGLKEDLEGYVDPLNEGFEPKRTLLLQNGDFRSEEAVDILKESDIIVTNPPFSLFREYIALLMEHNKKFIVLGNNNAITYKEIFPLIKANKIWLGVNSNKTMEFRIPDHYEKWGRVDEKGNKYGKVPAISWFTNLDHSRRSERIPLFREYTPDSYPKYDNYDAIDISKVSDIPEDYLGAMGVPITFLTKHNPDQFEILNANDFIVENRAPAKTHGLIKDKDGSVGGKARYARIVIRLRRG